GVTPKAVTVSRVARPARASERIIMESSFDVRQARHSMVRWRASECGEGTRPSKERYGEVALLWAILPQPHDACAFAADGTGRVNRKVGPGPASELANKGRPCASMIRRLIESPMPLPCGLVVKNASNMRSFWPAARPVPESLTEPSK